MSFRSIVRDVREGFGSLSRRSFEVRSSRHQEGKSHGSVHELEDHAVAQSGRWASLPPELLCDVIKKLETSESTWPARKNVVVCASVCKAWREMCKEIVPNLEVSGKLTFPVSLKQPGPRDGMIQCFIMRDKSSLTYRLFLCLSPALLPENGKFLLSAKRIRRTTCTEYVISTDADSISRSSSKYIGKLRSNFMSTKFIIYDTQPPYNSSNAEHQGRSSRRLYSKKVSPKVPSGNYIIAQVAYESNAVGNRGPRRMHCTMYSIPATSLDPGGVVPRQPELLSRSLENSFRNISFSKRIDSAAEFSSSRFSDIGMMENEHDGKERPLILKNETPRWHDDFRCWCLNFRGRVTVASVKNFQLIAATTPPATTAPNAPSAFQSGSSNHEKVLMQFGKVCKDIFTMDYRYPLSAFQAFAICLSSFDTKLACE